MWFIHVTLKEPQPDGAFHLMYIQKEIGFILLLKMELQIGLMILQIWEIGEKSSVKSCINLTPYRSVSLLSIYILPHPQCLYTQKGTSG